MDRKGIFSFLAIAFAATYAIQIPILASGMQIASMVSNVGQLLILPFMFMPALAAIITVKFITREGFGGLGLRFGAWKEYLVIGFLMPALFALIYLLTALLGLGKPDWELTAFLGMFTAAGVEPPAVGDTRLVLLGMFFATLTFGTLFNWLICFGEELGWRGYLLPKLMPLGKPRAYLLLGVIWGLWHLPLVWAGFTYNTPRSVPAILAFIVFTTILGTYLNELTLRTRSSILAGWAHGVFNTQKLGVWYLLFPSVSPFLGGYAGLIGLVIWAALAVWEARRGKGVYPRTAPIYG